jgi:hypothetical protein
METYVAVMLRIMEYEARIDFTNLANSNLAARFFACDSLEVFRLRSPIDEWGSLPGVRSAAVASDATILEGASCNSWARMALEGTRGLAVSATHLITGRAAKVLAASETTRPGIDR